ncbi:17329_t:CDS:2 [Cetraspora pellucida]|uniref:17329_t:CDS:1 n=1 Tax=Cetraspora pellucida TaxID=1433469 RepID=A0A9N9CPC7_9GLOM|nr:17329_t:CDS:2 [Cetraspora pellucida]
MTTIQKSVSNTSPSATEREDDDPIVKLQPSRHSEKWYIELLLSIKHALYARTAACTKKKNKHAQNFGACLSYFAHETKEPLAIIACGSFSPITYLHLRIFEMAKDYITDNTRFEIIGGYYSPVSDHYIKEGLAPSHHRVRMCELAVERTSQWLMVDAWESLQSEYTQTAIVMDHFNEEINNKRGGIVTTDGKSRKVKVMLLAGGDLIESFKVPKLWLDEDAITEFS